MISTKCSKQPGAVSLIVQFMRKEGYVILTINEALIMQLVCILQESQYVMGVSLYTVICLKCHHWALPVQEVRCSPPSSLCT